MSVEVDFNVWGQIYMDPGTDSWWWFTWIFDKDHWQRMSISPDSEQSSVQIVEEWMEYDINGTTKLWVHFRNNGTTGALFRPKTIVAPSR